MSDHVSSPAQNPPASPPENQRRGRSALHVLRAMRQRKVAVMLALGFSSGLPFLLTANTFGYWLRDEGTSLKAIGFISWVGFAYAFKVYWSPLVDRLDVPLLGRLGQRRGWMLLCQLLIAAGVDSLQAREGHPPVTALDLHPERQAEAAVEILLARLNDDQVEAPRYIPATLRLRTSTGG